MERFSYKGENVIFPHELYLADLSLLPCRCIFAFCFSNFYICFSSKEEFLTYE